MDIDFAEGNQAPFGYPTKYLSAEQIGERFTS